MKHNYQDFIVQNVSVIIGSALIGLGVRFVMLEKGADQFTANSIFWIVILIGLVFYTALVLLGVSLFDLSSPVAKPEAISTVPSFCV